MTDRKPITPEELAAILEEDERLATSHRDSFLADEQAAALDYYEAKPFGDEEDGLSQVVTPEVAEVVDYMTISIARTMVSGDRVVEFEAAESPPEPEAMPEATEDGSPPPQRPQPPNPADVAAEDATAAVEYSFMRQQDGYRVILDWIQSGNIEKIGIAKTCYEVTKKVKKSRGTVPAEALELLKADGVNIIAATPNEDESAFEIEIAQEVEDIRYADYPIPSEEYLFAPRTRHEDDCDYQCHRSYKSASDLIAMGFDREQVESLPDSNRSGQYDSREQARWDDETAATPANKRYWLCEEYKRVDMDDDGIAELVQVFRVGNVILERDGVPAIEEVDEAPFVVWCPFPRAHRLVGNSLADKVMDLQRIKSVVLRQQLNGLYLTNNPRMFVPEEGITENTIDDLLTVRPGGLVRGRAGMKPESLYEAFDMSKGMTMLEYITGERESRTGITRLNQGLDADALNKTATGTALMQAQGQQMEEFIARNFAEALARLFSKKCRLMQKAGKPFSIKVDGQVKTVDPSTWPEGLSATVRVGLGSGRKEQRLTYRAQLLEMQKEAFQIGLATKDNIFKNASAMVRDANLGIPTDYFLDPNSPEAQQIEANKPPVQDPEMLKVQAQQQAAQQKLEQDGQLGAAKLDQMREENALKLQLAREEAAEQARLADERFAHEASLSERRFLFEASLAERKAASEHEDRMTNTAVKISQNRPGGDLDK